MTTSRYVKIVHKPVACARCGRRFTPTRSDARYCSGACRVAAHRAGARRERTLREVLADADEATLLRLGALAARRLVELVEAEAGTDGRNGGRRARALLDHFAPNRSRLELELVLDEVRRDLTRRRRG